MEESSQAHSGRSLEITVFSEHCLRLKRTVSVVPLRIKIIFDFLLLVGLMLALVLRDQKPLALWEWVLTACLLLFIIWSSLLLSRRSYVADGNDSTHF